MSTNPSTTSTMVLETKYGKTIRAMPQASGTIVF